MTLNQFIRTYNIKPADAIVLQKKFFGMVDHFAIYIGLVNDEPTFVANYLKGVQVITKSEMNEFLKKLIPIKIDRFPGKEAKRPEALLRAVSQIGKKAYSYLSNNCEHFKNWVHYGNPRSEQVENLGKGLATGALVIAGIALLSEIFGD
jgi:hypothetical protein